MIPESLFDRLRREVMEKNHHTVERYESRETNNLLAVGFCRFDLISPTMTYSESYNVKSIGQHTNSCSSERSTNDRLVVTEHRSAPCGALYPRENFARSLAHLQGCLHHAKHNTCPNSLFHLRSLPTVWQEALACTQWAQTYFFPINSFICSTFSLSLFLLFPQTHCCCCPLRRAVGCILFSIFFLRFFCIEH